MSVGGAGELARAVYEALAARAFEEAAGYVHEQVNLLNVATGDCYSGRAGFIEFNRGWAAAFPDLLLASFQYCGSDRRAVVEYEMVGTHTGPLLTPQGHVPATGMGVQVRICDVLEVADGKVTYIRSYFDTVTMLRQLGVMAGTPMHAPDRRAPLELYVQTVDNNAPQRHKAIVHRFLQEVFNRRNPNAAADSCGQTYLLHGGPLGEARGLQEYQGVLASLFVALPDLELQILDTIAEDDRVVVRFSVSGTHLGPFQGISPTYKTMSASVTSTYRIADGRIVEEWWQGDLLLVLSRMEAAPSSLRHPF
jgi:predicted ester cyclase